jgi:hypothetical protein
MKANKKLNAAAVAEIKEIDDTLNLLRENWLTAKELNRIKYMKLIDKSLDERLVAMAKIDTQNEAVNN